MKTSPQMQDLWNRKHVHEKQCKGMLIQTFTIKTILKASSCYMILHTYSLKTKRSTALQQSSKC